MSMTASIGVVGPSHWSYMAAVISECLQRVVNAGEINSGSFPKGIVADAREFFRLVTQVVGGKIPQNPPASVNAFVIAADVLRASSQPAPETYEEIEKCLQRFSTMVDSFEQPRKLQRSELETAEELRQFLLRLQQQGESETYESHVALYVTGLSSRYS